MFVMFIRLALDIKKKMIYQIISQHCVIIFISLKKIISTTKIKMVHIQCKKVFKRPWLIKKMYKLNIFKKIVHKLTKIPL